MDKKIGLCTFGLLALLVLIMAFATYREHLGGFTVIYNSVWFTLLWITAATTGCYYIAINSLHKRLPVFLLHVSFLFILSGALVTRLTAKTGHIHLHENHQTTAFLEEWTRDIVVFPFSVSLKYFEIEYYPDTDLPADYVSIVELADGKTGECFERTISMNNILRYRGYRFYQSSFDEDLQGSILSVNHDTYGIAFSYAGYYMMFFSMLLILFDKRERFRCLLRKGNFKIQRFKNSKIQKFFYSVILIVFAAASGVLGLQTYAGGRFPLSNIYETLLVLSWLILLTGIVARRFSFLFVIFSLFMGSIILIISHVGLMKMQIAPLMPVLRSSLLYVHVLVIMVAYCLCGFITLNSVAALIMRLSKTGNMDYIKRMKETSELFMYPATFLMGAGIFIGAIWANQSWGRYWGWDPKEVWALITFLLMSFTFHEKR